MENKISVDQSRIQCEWSKPNHTNPDYSAVNGQQRKKFPQIFAAVSICYFCICGGNLQGYTSSAIPSMKKTSSERIATIIIGNDELRGHNLSTEFGIIGALKENEKHFLAGDAGADRADSYDDSWTTPGPNGQWLQLYMDDSQLEEFRNMSHHQTSWISGLSPLGAFVGSVIAPLPLGRFGPRGAIMFLSGPMFLLSWITTACAPFPKIVYFARFLGGLAIGISTSCAPVYIMDTAPLHLRGPLGTLPQCFFVVGILISFILGSFLEWRETALICATLSIPGIFLLLLAPESPKWLLSKKRLKDAQKSYFWLNGRSEGSLNDFLTLKNSVKQSKNMDTADFNQNQDKHLVTHCEKGDSESAEAILADSSSSSSSSTSYSGGSGSGTGADTEPEDSLSNNPNSIISVLCNLLSEPGALKATGVVFGLMLFQQITGINGVNFYTVTIFNEALGSRAVLSGHTSSIIVAITLTLASFSSIYLIEKLGRKILLILSVTFIGLGAFSIGTFFYIKENSSESDPEFVKDITWIPLVSLIVFVVAFSVGYGPVCWIIGAEILNSKLRPIVSPIAVGFNWFCVFAVAKTYPDLVITLGTYGTFWLYGSLAIVGLIFTLVFVPETKGKSEKEIQQFFLS